MPLAGLMVFAFMMGARKFILFDVVNMELLGCALGAVVALPICLLRTSRPLTTLIYRMLVPAFALVLIVLNSFPGTTMPMFFAAWLTYVFYGAVAILALASPGGRGPFPGVLGRLGVRHGGGGLRAVLASGPGVRAHRPLPGRGRRPGALGGEHVLLRGRHRGGALGAFGRHAGAGERAADDGWARGMPARGPTRRPKACRRAARPWPTRPA